MYNSHCSITLVHVLTSGTARTRERGVEITFRNMCLTDIRKSRKDFDERKAGPPLTRGIKGRHTYKSMHSCLMLERSICACSGYFKRNTAIPSHRISIG